MRTLEVSLSPKLGRGASSKGFMKILFTKPSQVKGRVYRAGEVADIPYSRAMSMVRLSRAEIVKDSPPPAKKAVKKKTASKG